MSKNYDLIVIGGGASGCATAITAARNGVKVLILEKEDRLLKKVSLTGNGQCNLANSNSIIGRFNSSFPNRVFDTVSLERIIDYYESLRLLLIEDNMRWFPYSKHSATVVNAILSELDLLSIDVKTCCGVNSIKKENDIFIVNDNFNSKYLLLATGSNATKGTDSLNLAKALGHKVFDFKPSLTHIYTDTKKIKGLNGIRVYNCNVKLELDGKIVANSIGDVIFRDYGVSGSAIFDVSVHFARAKAYKKAALILDFLPAFETTLVDLIDINKGIKGFFHKSIARAIMSEAKNTVPYRLAEVIKNFRLENATLGPINHAQLASGGVVTDEVSQISLESRFISNLYFAGEILDVDGECGGFNLMWAVASGIIVASHITSKLKLKDTYIPPRFRPED